MSNQEHFPGTDSGEDHRVFESDFQIDLPSGVSMPIKEEYSTENYACIVKDADDRLWYFNDDGSLDGTSRDC